MNGGSCYGKNFHSRQAEAHVRPQRTIQTDGQTDWRNGRRPGGTSDTPPGRRDLTESTEGQLGFGAITEKKAPWLSVTEAIRPYGESIAGETVLPPSFSTFATAASVSLTWK